MLILFVYQVSLVIMFGFLVIIMLVIMFEWLFRYFVYECNIRLVFNVSGFCNVGFKKVLFIMFIVLIFFVRW